MPRTCLFNLYFEWNSEYRIRTSILLILYMSWPYFNILHTFSMHIKQLRVAINFVPGDFWSVSLYVVWLGKVICNRSLPLYTTYSPSDPSWRWNTTVLILLYPNPLVSWLSNSIWWLLIRPFWSDTVASAFATTLHRGLNCANIALFRVCPCRLPFTLSLWYYGK